MNETPQETDALDHEKHVQDLVDHLIHYRIEEEQEHEEILKKISKSARELKDNRLLYPVGAFKGYPDLLKASLNALNTSATKQEFNKNWNIITKNFDLLYSVPENVNDLKQTILQLAVQGKLTEQWRKENPNVEPASVLLEMIQKEKEKLIAEGKIKKQKTLPPIKDNEKPFELPAGWEWCKMEEICESVTAGATPPKNIFNTKDGVPFLKVYNIKNQKIDFNYCQQFIDRDYHKTKQKRAILYPGDVVMNIVGPPLGKIAIIPTDYPEWNCNQAIVYFRPIIKKLNEYLYTYLLAGIFLNSIELIGTAGQDNISVSKSRNIAIPLPPIIEQKQIVDKVDSLMALCDELEKQQQQSAEKQQNLLNTILNEVVV